MIPQVAKRLFALDALRCAAALAVVSYHYTFSAFIDRFTSASFPGSVGAASRYGYLGVDLFLLISGFVVLMSAWGRSPLQFVISRASRLYPCYWVAVTMTAITVASVSVTTFHVTPLQYAANLTMLQSPLGFSHVDPVYWTLWVELRFYAMLFVLVCIGFTTGRMQYGLWGWLSSASLISIVHIPQPSGRILLLLLQPGYAHYFVAGMALFLIHRDGMSVRFGAILGAAYVCALIQSLIKMREVEAHYATHLSASVVFALISLFFALMLAVSLHALEQSIPSYLQHAGNMTYPLYLIHPVIGFTALNALKGHVGPWTSLIFVMGAMVSCAALMAKYVDRPAGRWLRERLSLWAGSRASSRTHA